MSEKRINLMEVVLQGEEPPNCDQTLGIEFVHVTDGVAVTKWEIDEKFINGNGVVMGGFVSAVADTTMAYAISSLLKQEQVFASINLATTFHRPARLGTMWIEARVEKFGKSVAYLVADLKQDEKLVASAVSSVMIMSN